MSTLTLTLDDDLLRQAEAYAHRTGTDLSQVVAQALRPLVQPPPAEQEELNLPPVIAELYGCISLPADYDYKAHLADLITDRKHA